MNSVDKNKTILDIFTEKKEFFYSHMNKMNVLMTNILYENGVNVHSITARVKEYESLRDKVNGSNGKYNTIEDITDIVGLRIITYYPDDVDRIADIIKNEFKIDEENSIDKRKQLDPDRFGYLSLHYVIELPESRWNLIEYKRFAGQKIEVQIRSILQHTWAEIEHDLGYKNKLDVPREVKRNFSLIAGLLEVADNEFIKTRDLLKQYTKELPEQITNNPDIVLIDQASLGTFLKKNDLIRAMEQKIINIVGASLVYNKHSVSSLLKYLTYLNVTTILTLDKLINENKELIITLANTLLQDVEERTLYNGISVFYLCYILIGRTGSVEEAHQYLESHTIGDSDERLQFAKQLVQFANNHS